MTKLQDSVVQGSTMQARYRAAGGAPSSPTETPWERRPAVDAFVDSATRTGPRLRWAQGTQPVPTSPDAVSSPIWSPVEAAPVAASPRRAPQGECDARLLAILAAPAAPGETTMLAFARKERELTAALVALPVLEALALHRRLTVGAAGDALVAAFGRLVIERRQRLLGVLADARRREAVMRARAA